MKKAGLALVLVALFVSGYPLVNWTHGTTQLVWMLVFCVLYGLYLLAYSIYTMRQLVELLTEEHDDA